MDTLLPPFTFSFDLSVSNRLMCMCNSSKVSSRERVEEAMRRCCLWVRRLPQQRLLGPLACPAARRRPVRPWLRRRGPTRWRSARGWRGCRSQSRHSSVRAATPTTPSSATTTTTPSPSPDTSARRAAATGRAAAPSATSPSAAATAATSALPSPPPPPAVRLPPPRLIGSCPVVALRPRRPPQAGSSLRESAPCRTSTYRSWDRCNSPGAI
jgi:hypothetical protein